MRTLKSIFAFIFFTIIGTSSYSECQDISRCCILMNVSENDKELQTEYEIWDVYFNFADKTFNVKVASFIEKDVSLNPEHSKCWYTYVWQQQAKSITKIAKNKFEIITEGRWSPHDMRLQLTIDNELNRVTDMVATIPIGNDGKVVKKYIINKTDKTIKISPLYNSAYKSK